MELKGLTRQEAGMPEGQKAINLPIDLASQLSSVPVFQLLTN